MERKRFEGKRALVTGAGRGIGAGIAKRLLAEGARVCINRFEDSEAEVGLTEEMARAFPNSVLMVQADVRDEAEVDRLVESTAKTFGGLDLVVNNAGVESIHSATELALSEWDRILNTNLRGAFVVARCAARHMQAQGTGGVIVNISSIHAEIPRLGTAHYCASKAGLEMLTRSLALEWAPDGIRVAGVAPGAIETDINREVLDQIGRDRFARWIPLGRIGTVDDVAGAVLFLCSDEAAYITGTTLRVDGAYLLNTVQYDPRTL